MLKKFKKKVQHILGNDSANKKIDFENQNIQLNGKDYLFCRAVIPAIPEILSVERAVYNGKTPLNYEVFEKEIQNQHQNLFLLVRYGDCVIAYVSCNYIHKDACIKDIAIMPRFQRREIATKMMQLIITEAQKMKCKQVILDIRQSNLQAQKFYSELGFKKEHLKRHYYSDNNEDAYKYIYPLKGEN